MIPENVLEVIDTLEKGGHEAFLVGGSVRDMLRGREPHDWDITTNALPRQVMSLFPENTVITTGLRHGTVTVMCGGEPVEITTYRSEGRYRDHRRPESVSFVGNIDEDLVRRDFTVNAIAYNPSKGYYDPLDGLSDIENKVLRAVGEPSERFDEDALRILRGVRFCSELGYGIEEQTKKAMEEKAYLLKDISGERIFAELKRICMGENALEALLSCGSIIGAAVPEVLPSVGFDQMNRHHIYDVWEHSVRALASAPFDLTVRLALLFHDVGKPASFTKDANGEGHFYGHAKLSAEMAERALGNLKADRHTSEEVVWLVKMHDYILNPDDDKTAKRLVSKYGFERTERLLEIKIADNFAQSPKYGGRGREAAKVLDEVRKLEEEEPCLTLKDLSVKGGDIMALGLKGPEVGKALNKLLQLVIDGKCENEKSALLSRL